MNQARKRMIFIKTSYWLGIAADALWAFALLVPTVLGILLGNADFNPNMQTRLIMGIGGSLMTGWTFLLIWAVQKPIERRMVALLTAFPVVFGLFILALLGYLGGNTSNLWILIKTTILFLCMITNYIFATKIEVK